MNTVAHDDGDAPDVIPVENTMQEQATAFRDRFITLLEEAGKYGFSGIAMLCSYDPMQDVTTRVYARVGNHYAITGLMYDVVSELEAL